MSQQQEQYITIDNIKYYNDGNDIAYPIRCSCDGQIAISKNETNTFLFNENTNEFDNQINGDTFETEYFCIECNNQYGELVYNDESKQWE